jgi:hypothetical protein
MAYHDQRRPAWSSHHQFSREPRRRRHERVAVAQNVLMLIGMFWVSYRSLATFALLSLSIVPFLYYSVGYYSGHPPAARGCKGWKAKRCRSSQP